MTVSKIKLFGLTIVIDMLVIDVVAVPLQLGRFKCPMASCQEAETYANIDTFSKHMSKNHEAETAVGVYETIDSTSSRLKRGCPTFDLQQGSHLLGFAV